jgi:two-component system OmpR family sensor kinase
VSLHSQRARPAWRRWTIRHELALLVLATLLPFAAIGVYWTREDYQAEQARIQARALRMAREVSAEVDQFIADTGALVEALARVPSVKRGEQPQVNQLLGELVERYPSYESLFVAATNGQILASGGQDVLPPGNRQTYIQETLRRAATLITDPIAPRNSGRHVVVVATPVWDETGTPLGIVGASVNLLRLRESMRRAELPENSSVLVVDRAGRIVARRTEPEQWVGRSALDSSAVRDALRLKEGVSEGDFVDGISRLSGFAGAKTVPWEVIVGIPEDEAYAAVRRELWRSLARLLLVVAVAGSVAWVLSRRLTRPIGELAQAARTFAAGTLSHRVRPRGPDELDALGATLNAMAAALQQQMDALEEARHREREAGARALEELRRLHSEFIAVAAHELRTPVAGAKSYAELLLRDDVELAPSVRRQALIRLDAVCERLSRLVRSLLGASRIEAGRLEVQLEPVDVAAVARRVVEDFSVYAPGHDLCVEVLPPPIPPVALVRAPIAAAAAAAAMASTLAQADAERLEDVLVNLLSNATKYAPEGTAIQVRVRPAVLAGAAVGPAGNGSPARAGSAGSVELEVVDRGPGIPEAEQTAIFQRFRRGAGVAAGGVGLGLFIARAYVQAMGGEIGVRSRPGAGATFWMRLPAATLDVPASTSSASERVQVHVEAAG